MPSNADKNRPEDEAAANLGANINGNVENSGGLNVSGGEVHNPIYNDNRTINYYPPAPASGQDATLEAAIETYLRDTRRLYAGPAEHYTPLHSELALDPAEQQRLQRSGLLTLLSRQFPPEKEADFSRSGRSELEKETRLPGPVLEQVAQLPAAALLGPPGAGKTTTLTSLAYHYAGVFLGKAQAAPDDRHAGKIPLVVPLGGYAGQDLREFIAGLLARRQPRYPFSEELARQLTALLDGGRLFLLFDALNEVPEQSRPEAIAQLNDFLNLYCSERAARPCTAMLTCRQADYDKSFTRLPRLALEPLDDPAIAAFLANYFPGEPEAVAAITAHLDASQGLLRDFVRNPFFLKVVVDLHAARLPLPSTRGELLQVFSRNLVKTALKRLNPEERGLLQQLLPGFSFTSSDFAALPPKQQELAVDRLGRLLLPFLSDLAYSMLIDPSQGTETSRDWILSNSAARPPLEIIYYDPVTRQRQVSSLILPPGHLLELASLGGLVSLTPASGDPLEDRARYAHQLLQEYFAAAYLNQPEIAPAELQQAVNSYDFDEVFPLLADISVNPSGIIELLEPFDLKLAAHCAGLLPPDRLDQSIRSRLIKRAMAFLNSGRRIDRNKAFFILARLKAMQEIQSLLTHSDSEIRSSAVYAIEVLGVKEAIPLIISLLQDEDSFVRSSSVNALKELGEKEVIPLVIPFLQHKDSFVRGNTVYTLSKLGAKESLPQIISLLQDEDSFVRSKTVEALSKLGEKKAIPFIIPLLQDEDSSVRQSVVEALSELRDEEAIPKIIPLLKDPDRGVLYKAVDALSKLASKKVIPLIISLLQDEDSYFRSNAVSALGKLRAEEAIPQIIPLLQDEDSSVLESAVNALKELGTKKVIPQIIPLLQNENILVRITAVDALSALEAEEALPQIIPLLQDQDSNVRYFAVDALSALGGTEIIPLIIPLLQDQDGSVRQGAVFALSKLGAQEVTSLIIPLLQDKSGNVRSDVVYALTVLGTKQAVPLVIPLLQDQDNKVRGSAVHALKELAEREHMTLFNPYLAHPDPDIRSKAWELVEYLKRKFRLPKSYGYDQLPEE